MTTSKDLHTARTTPERPEPPAKPKRRRVVGVQLTAGELKVLLANTMRDSVAAIAERGLRDAIKYEVKAAVAETLQRSADNLDEQRASLLEQQRLVVRVLGDTDAALVRVERWLGALPVLRAPRALKKKKPARKKARKKARKLHA